MGDPIGRNDRHQSFEPRFGPMATERWHEAAESTKLDARCHHTALAPEHDAARRRKDLGLDDLRRSRRPAGCGGTRLTGFRRGVASCRYGGTTNRCPTDRTRPPRLREQHAQTGPFDPRLGRRPRRLDRSPRPRRVPASRHLRGESLRAGRGVAPSRSRCRPRPAQCHRAARRPRYRRPGQPAHPLHVLRRPPAPVSSAADGVGDGTNDPTRHRRRSGTADQAATASRSGGHPPARDHGRPEVQPPQSVQRRGVHRHGNAERRPPVGFRARRGHRADPPLARPASTTFTRRPWPVISPGGCPVPPCTTNPATRPSTSSTISPGSSTRLVNAAG